MDNKYQQFTRSKVLQRLLRYPAAGLLTHWVFQGMLYMDRTERLFKIGLDLGATCILSILLLQVMPLIYAISAAFILAHSLNLVFNAQLWVVLKHYGYVRLAQDNFDAYARGLSNRMEKEPGLLFAAAYGSLARRQWNPSSDLDVRIVRKAGFLNGFRACVFVMSERTRALFNKFPLDVYLLDSFAPLQSLRDDEIPLILMDARSA